jgi:hypothetical protein
MLLAVDGAALATLQPIVWGYLDTSVSVHHNFISLKVICLLPQVNIVNTILVNSKHASSIWQSLVRILLKHSGLRS